nr:uncharacterized protein K02A2.6-like [Quercus suber]
MAMGEDDTLKTYSDRYWETFNEIDGDFEDAAIRTFKIRRYDVKRVLVDQGSEAEIMYPDLYKGLNPKPEDLERYDSPLIGFDGRMVIPWGRIKLPVHAGDEEVQKVMASQDEDKYFQVGAQLPSKEKTELMAFLKDNVDVFAWSTYDVLGVDPEFICHQLNVNPGVVPRKQPLRRSSKEHVKGYHQIPLALSDQEKTAFRALTSNYHYQVMPFDLKNAGSIYQRMVTRMFEVEIERNVETYIDDMVVKSKQTFEHLEDLKEAFLVLRRHRLHLNASKCSFGVGLGKLLGYMITHRGIEVNPDQIKAIKDLHPPWNPKGVQKLTGLTTALNRFISRSTD